MKTFKIAVDWSMYGVVQVEAESLENAIEIAKNDTDIPLPEGDYIDGSWNVNCEVSEELNKG